MPPTRQPRPTAGTSPARRRHARRDQFIDIAQRVFAGRGYHGVTMQMVCESAGITKPILYQYFSGKLELYLAVVQRYLDQLATAVRETLAAPLSDYDTVRGTITAFFDIVDGDASGTHVLIFDSAVPSEPSVRWRVQTAKADCTATVAAALRRRGETPWRTQLLASWLVGAGIAAAGQWHRTGRPVPKCEAVETTIQLCWAGVQSVAAVPARAAVA
ncbi:TetR/AcrR family transcriptional regulator [Nocardia asteroides]|uniref:TetR/AcrR family transcriptional regulator n=1 Tax=Nocardia asteroides TaxID=1824 RepID=UPI001E2CB42E|nr:TetR/AcrR family transcriptional regulator [Nocardia asteroides]UGT55204.1 TetR/AcrR family transcriptional regulator [Nocardia asteroides]